MTRSVRHFPVFTTLLFGVVLALIATLSSLRAEERLPEPELGDNGLHVQSWFHEGFLDLSEDLAEAKAQGKDLIIMVEQPGCPYCRELHQVNLRIPQIVETMKENYMVVQLDMRGSREVTDFDGETLEERDAVRKWRVAFTPTLIFIPGEEADSDGTIRDRAAMMMPGYFKPFHFDTMLHFISEDAYKGGDFQRYLDDRAARMRAEGKDVDIW